MSEQPPQAAYEQFAQGLRDNGLTELFLRYVYDGPQSITLTEEQARWNQAVPDIEAFMKNHQVNPTTFLFTIAGILAHPNEGQKAVEHHDSGRHEIEDFFKPRVDQ